MKLTRTLAAGLTVLALTAAGCSDDDDDAPADQPVESETTDPPDDGNGALDGSEDDGNGALDGSEDDGNGALDGSEDDG
jgi:hypothetical protein